MQSPRCPSPCTASNCKELNAGYPRRQHSVSSSPQHRFHPSAESGHRLASVCAGTTSACGLQPPPRSAPTGARPLFFRRSGMDQHEHLPDGFKPDEELFDGGRSGEFLGRTVSLCSQPASCRHRDGPEDSSMRCGCNAAIGIRNAVALSLPIWAALCWWVT
jgi:hypothetical protein